MLVMDFSEFNFAECSGVKTRRIDCFQNRDNTPFPRWGSTMCVYEDKIYIFGGRNKNDFNDLWFFNPDEWTWKHVKNFY